MMKTTLRQVLWICLILAVKVKTRKIVTEEEKQSYYVNPHYNLCEEAQCLAIEDIFNETVDKYRMPCEDYFKYACNRNYTGSQDHEPFPKDPNQVLNDLMYILDGDVLARDDLDTGNYALEIERNIFKHCKERGAYTADEKLHYERTVLPDFRANRLEPEYEYTRGELLHWDGVDLKYALKGFGFAFFDVEIYQPYKNKTDERYILIRPPPHESMRLSNLLNQRFSAGSGHYKHKKHTKLEQFVDELGGIIPRSTREPNATNIVERTINDWTMIYEEKMTHGCAKIDWLTYLSRLFGKVGEKVHGDTVIKIQNIRYFKALVRQLSHTNDVDVIADYVHLRFVSKSIGLVDTNYRTYSILPQIEGLPCTPGVLVGALHKYADKYFSAESRNVLEVLTLRVRDAVVARLQRAFTTAPDAVLKLLQNFALQLTKAKIYYGYPAWLMNTTSPYRLYGTKKYVPPSTNFYDNQARIIEQLLEEKLKTWKQSNKPIIDLTELTKGLQSNRIEVNIAVQDEPTEILIPFGYFSEKDYKFFSSQLFDSINYGAAAAEIAYNLYYEIIDSIFDTRKANIPRCIIDRVPSYVRERDTFAKKAVTYLLALETAYEALPIKHSLPIQFVDFGAMADTDLFFLSFAKSLCSITPEVSSSTYAEEKERKKSYRTDDYYTLSHYIKFTMENSVSFADNYLCKEQLDRLEKSQCDPLKFEYN